MHNSYKSPDSINAIDWSLKARNRDQMDYYKGLIALRKAHPAFRMTSADQIATHLVFDKINSDKTPNLISYTLKDHANGDTWKDIKVIFNGSNEPRTVKLPKGIWSAVILNGKIDTEGGLGEFQKEVTVAPCSAVILKR